MPIYQFKCSSPDCTHTEDIFSSISDRDLPRACPVCSSQMIRVLSPTSFKMAGTCSFKPLAKSDPDNNPRYSDMIARRNKDFE